MLIEKLGKELLFLDGGMGTLLQENGLEPGELPEVWNITHRELIVDIHKNYLRAGSQIILTNTFGANHIKLRDVGYTVKTVVEHAVENVRKAAQRANIIPEEYMVGLDIGPTGKLLEPLGDLSFDAAYEAFREVVTSGVSAGVDIIYIETMSDLYEVKAAILAAKEHSNLPILVTMIFDEKGKLLTGGDVPSMVALLEGLRVDALGINCGMGPDQMQSMLQQIKKYTSLPIIIKPNAGLPKQDQGHTYYDINPDIFAVSMKKLVEQGACVVGGCCGTTPLHLKEMIQICKNMNVSKITKKNRTLVSSYGTAVEIGEEPVIIGERINPTGKKRLKEALKTNDMDYILKEGILQQEQGAHILDVNVGLPDIDEPKVMKHVITELQSICNLPLQIDTVDPNAMEMAMRIYNGKPMINSVSGKKESMQQVFPLIQKYGGVVVALTLNEKGIPETAKERFEIAKNIVEEAKVYGIDKKDIVVDVLAMTISSEKQGAKIALDAIQMVSEHLGVRTVLGVSNISFGLPNRPIINSCFYALAMHQGLSAAIINPLSEEMMKSYYAYRALMGYDNNCEAYVAKYATQITEKKHVTMSNNITLNMAIEKGLKDDVEKITKKLLEDMSPLDIINEQLIPALDVVGKGFEKGTVFLPQLLMSADAAKIAFNIIKEKLTIAGEEVKKQKIILATVKGDIHDIGKNIVKVLLENYSFEVIDLGKDVDPEVIVETSLEQDVKLVGLSALMTTTVSNMEKTIQLLKDRNAACKVMVGGAVLNQEYSDLIGADFYAKDAMQSVYYSQSVLEKEQD